METIKWVFSIFYGSRGLDDPAFIMLKVLAYTGTFAGIYQLEDIFFSFLFGV